MDSTVLKEERPCTFEDLAKLEGMMCKAKRELRFTGIFVLIISVLLPFLPPKYSGSNGMLDIMSYGSAVSGIVVVLAVVFLWSVYYMLYGLYKDLKHKTKISVSTYVVSTGLTKYRGKNYTYFSAAGLPYRLGRLPASENESVDLKAGDRIIVEYSKYGKKYLGRIET